MTVDTSNLGKFYIAGQWVAPRSQANMPVLNPANERQIGIVPLGDAADVDEAVAAAVSAFPAYSQTRKSERVALLQSLMKVTQSRFEDLAQAMRMEMGAPITIGPARRRPMPPSVICRVSWTHWPSWWNGKL